jgi:hypothetical protein
MTLGFVLLAGAGGLALSGIGRGHAAAPAYPCGLQACRASQTKVPLRGYEGAYVAADPKSPGHVVVTDTDLIAAKCGWHTTFDGGRTWTDGAFTLPPSFTGCRLNPPSGGHVPSGSVAIGAYGQVYAVFGSANAADSGRESVLVAISLDGGRTFLPARVAVAAPQPNIGLARPLMTLGRGPSGKDVLLLSFWGCHQIAQGTSCDRAYFARSDDAGSTFTPPVVVNKPPGGQNPSQPAVDADGTIYLTFQRRFADGHDDIVLAKSSDNGLTFTESAIDSERNVGLLYDPAKLIVDPKSGALYAVWSDSRTSSEQIFFRKSTNKGASWFEAALLSPDPGVTGSSRSPSIAIAPDGRIDVVYYHTAPEVPNFDDVYLESSFDGGATFKVRQVNPKPIDRTLGYSGPAASLGEVGNHYPPTVSSLDSTADVVWSDTLNATTLTQTQDAEFRTVLFAATTP